MNLEPLSIPQHVVMPPPSEDSKETVPFQCARNDGSYHASKEWKKKKKGWKLIPIAVKDETVHERWTYTPLWETTLLAEEAKPTQSVLETLPLGASQEAKRAGSSPRGQTDGD